MTLAGKVEIANRLAENNLVNPDTYIKFLNNELTEEQEIKLIYKLYETENEKPSIFSIIYTGIKRIFRDISRNYRSP